ncbi:MAG: tRNA (N6-threonylcarbamoyladenosine(37)-N6)-methyltransferase TrmO [Candidatus Promineifilaceae bacterium]
MDDRKLDRIEIKPIGFVRRMSAEDDEKDRSLVSEIVLTSGLARALDGIHEWSHIFVIYWLNRVMHNDQPVLHFPGSKPQSSPVGILATRAPIHPNPIGLTLVELIKREENVLLVRGLEAYDGTPVLDIKPYPDWEHGRFIVVTDFRVPEWLRRKISKSE